MNRGPKTGGRPAIVAFAQKVQSAWTPVPDWVAELAAYADQHGLRVTGERIGYSASAVSTVLSSKYAGDVSRVEEAVRGALMGLEVACPVLGTIGRDRCLDEQRQPFRATSHHRAALFHACRSGCPHARNFKGGEDE